MTKSKSFIIPKKEIIYDKGYVQEINLGNHEDKEIQSIITNSFICNKMALNGLKVQKVKIFVNKDSEERYLEKKTELKNLAPGRMPSETYAFSFLPTFAIDKIAREGGLKIGNMRKSVLGYAKKGVHLFRYADVCAMDAIFNNGTYAKEVYGNTIWTPSKTSLDTNACLVIFKVLMGRCHTVMVNDKGNEIDPSPIHDIHIPDQKPVPEEKLIKIKRDKSLMYIYEYDMKTLSLVPYPRSIYPYAAIYYTKPASLSFKSSLSNTAFNNAFNVKKSTTNPSVNTSAKYAKNKVTTKPSVTNEMARDKNLYSAPIGSSNTLLTNPHLPINTRADILDGKDNHTKEYINEPNRYYNSHTSTDKKISLSNFEESLSIVKESNDHQHSSIGDLRPNSNLNPILGRLPSLSALGQNHSLPYQNFVRAPPQPSLYNHNMKERHLLPNPPNFYETSLENKHLRGVDGDKISIYPGAETRPNILACDQDDRIHHELFSSYNDINPKFLRGSGERKINWTVFEKCNNLLLSLGLYHEVDFFNFLFSIMLKLLSTFVEKFEEQEDKQAVDKTITLMIEYMSVFNSDTSTPGIHILRGELQNIIEDLVEYFRSGCNYPNETNLPTKNSSINHTKVENGSIDKSILSHSNAFNSRSPKLGLSDKEDGIVKKELSDDCKDNFLHSKVEKHVNDHKINDSVELKPQTKRIDPRLEKRLLSNIQELNKGKGDVNPLRVVGENKCEKLENLLPKMDIDERVLLFESSVDESKSLNKRKESDGEKNSISKKCKKRRMSKANPLGDLSDVPSTFHGRGLIMQADLPLMIPLTNETRHVNFKGKRMCYQDPRSLNERYKGKVLDGENKFYRKITEIIDGYYHAPIPCFEENSHSSGLNSSLQSNDERFLAFPESPNESHDHSIDGTIKNQSNPSIKSVSDVVKELPFKAKIAHRRSRCKTKTPNSLNQVTTINPPHPTIKNQPNSDELNTLKAKNVGTFCLTLAASVAKKLDKKLEPQNINTESSDKEVKDKVKTPKRPLNIFSRQPVVRLEDIQTNQKIVSLMSPEFVASAIEKIAKISLALDKKGPVLNNSLDRKRLVKYVEKTKTVSTDPAKLSKESIHRPSLQISAHNDIECIILDDL